MKINPYIFIAIIYFFFNSVFLPFGLTYTTLLSPFLYFWICKKTSREILLPFLSILALFSVAHIGEGVDIKAYMVSVLNYTGVYIFCWSFYVFLKSSADIGKVFRTLLILNIVLCILALLIFPTQSSSLLWMSQDISRGIEDVKRLKLFTYEASYYALIFVPLFLYYFLKICLGNHELNAWLLLFAITVPLALSFSLGVIGSIMISLIMLFCFHFEQLVTHKNFRAIFILASFILIAGLFLFLFIFPDNEFVNRIVNIINGDDTSGKGRTSDAFLLANDIANQRSSFWGVGPGQIKILGGDIIRSYYLYNLDFETIAIPNAVAETYAIFGWMGLSLRFILLGALFFISRVWADHYRFALFLFMFVYQFTGSFITNIAEYVIWILAFTPAFSSFSIKQPSGMSYTYTLMRT